jgi:hypothetical protein
MQRSSYQEAFRFFSAHRFFIASESLFRQTAGRAPRFLATLAVADSFRPEVRDGDGPCAQRLFITSDSLPRPAGVSPPVRFRPGRAPVDAGGRPTRFLESVLLEQADNLLDPITFAF